MTFNVPEQPGHDDHLNVPILLTQAATIGAARVATERSSRREQQGAFRDDRPSRR